MSESSASVQKSHQTTRLGVGRHDGPGDVVCIMELASMLAGERFSDRPASVCPIIGAILRAYNDSIDDRRRRDLYRYAAEAVGTRGSYALQYRRAAVAIEWARPGYRQRGRVSRALICTPPEPLVDSGPEEIARYVLGSFGRRYSDAAHAAVLRLIDALIELGLTRDAPALPARLDETTLSEPEPTPLPEFVPDAVAGEFATDHPHFLGPNVMDLAPDTRPAGIPQNGWVLDALADERSLALPIEGWVSEADLNAPKPQPQDELPEPSHADCADLKVQYPERVLAGIR